MLVAEERTILNSLANVRVRGKVREDWGLSGHNLNYMILFVMNTDASV